jgi:hypothetical protein
LNQQLTGHDSDKESESTDWNKISKYMEILQTIRTYMIIEETAVDVGSLNTLQMIRGKRI